MKKVLFISSTGGHLTELLELKRMFKKYDYTIITEKTNTPRFKTDKELLDFLYQEHQKKSEVV